MRRRIFSVVVCVFLVMNAVNGFKFDPFVLSASYVSDASVIHVPDDYSTIQAAVNAASPGDIILIASGVYYENVVIDKSMKILGENSANAVVRGIAGNFTPTIEVRADYVEISGLTARNGYSGIWLNHTNYGSIHGNILTATAMGGGIELSYSNGNLIVNNTAIDNGRSGDLGFGLGIHMEYSNSNLISNNLMIKNAAGGLLVTSSHGNTITKNTFREGGGGILLIGGSTQNIISFNEESSGGIGLGYSSNNTIQNNWIIDGGGIGLGYSPMNVIKDNTIINARILGLPGIAVTQNSPGNLVIGNTVSNSLIGVDIAGSDGSYFYHNSFINNTNNHTRDEFFPSVNFWNNSFCEGNYWSNYTGVDADADGIGDTPHTLYALNLDYHPLMKPYLEGDVNHDGIVQIKDLGRIGLAWNTSKGMIGYNPHADLNMDTIINTADTDILRKNWQKRLQT